jgi:aspartyl-tRNA(Asn)/glutamyl-tRNA(Gln) amidotransferase subunit C
MSITIEELRKIAKLARIELTPEEEQRHTETISVVLDYMKILNEVDTTGVVPTAQVTGLLNVVREDIPRDSKLQKELLTQMPKVKMEELVVPGVFNEEE